jgi:alpha-tubulin suppressor-like RCC1 family protein
MELGFQPTTRCRVNVGRDSEAFPGQVRMDREQFCDAYDSVAYNGSDPCGVHQSPRRCRLALQNTGLLCAWNYSASTEAGAGCVHLARLQGSVGDVAYGADFILLLTTNKTVWAFGGNDFGQLGHNETGKLAQVVGIPVPVYAVVAGLTHALALGQGGAVYGWGNNHQGQLGRRSILAFDPIPQRVGFPSRELISCVSSGALHSAATSDLGTVYTWGSNAYGQLGTEEFFRGGFARGPTALPRTLFDGDAIVNVQCGMFHTMVASDVATYSFGRNTQGQLGRPGFDEVIPAFPILRAPTPYIPMPQYESALHGQVDCVDIRKE